ncbi:MAG TPA: succinate dehydrogenase assembly factor 2 [Qipengyuania sp.]|nr:succinate dehydrogenase assembly factor 2 [Qipengyuania sp.]
MDTASRIRRLKFRAWHRGTREADYMLGGFFDRYHAGWNDRELAWFEALVEEDDVDVMAWALGTAQVPERFAGPQIAAMQRLDYVEV